MYFKHTFTHKFNTFAHAFIKKFNDPNGIIFVTIWKCTQLDPDRFAFVRRYDSKFSSIPVYERTIFNRKDKTVEECMFDESQTDKIAEKSVYKAEGDSVLYQTFLYKNPGWKSFLRRKAHAWGIETMNDLLAKEKDILKKRKELILQKKELVVAKTKEKVNDMVNEMTNKLPLNKYL